jgi:hypothetical protein
MSTFVGRFLRAIRLEAAVYEEVEADRRATPQALLVVALSSVAGGIGLAGISGYDARGLVIGTLAALVGWLAWATLIYLVGARFLPEAQTRAAPGVVRVVGLVPGFAWPVYVLSSIWTLAAMVVAVRQALDFTTTRRAIAVCAAGWVLVLVVAAVMGVMFAPTVQ